MKLIEMGEIRKRAIRAAVLRPTTERRIGEAERLVPFFKELVSPLSNCIEKLMEGGLSPERLREKLKGPADMLEQIMLADGDQSELHWKFWNAILELPLALSKLSAPPSEACAGIKDRYMNVWRLSQYDRRVYDEEGAYPRVGDYPHVPYLFVASALFMHFLQEDDIALRVLEKYWLSKDNAVNTDYSFLLYLARLKYYQGQLTGVSIAPVEQMLATTTEHQQRISVQCALVSCDQEMQRKVLDLQNRERRAELAAMNNYTYYVAEDLARGIKDAVRFEATAFDYALQLKDTLDRQSLRSSDDNLGLATWIEERRNDFLDTYAYTSMVVEARRQAPDIEIFKHAARILEPVVEDLERKADHATHHLDFTALRIVRNHYAAARDLAGE